MNDRYALFSNIGAPMPDDRDPVKSEGPRQITPLGQSILTMLDKVQEGGE